MTGYLALLLEEGSGPQAQHPWLQCVCAKRGPHAACLGPCVRVAAWRWWPWALTAVLGLTLTGCIVAFTLPRATAGDACKTSGCAQGVSSVWEALDSSVDPCHDFYSFSCGRWLHRNSPPPAGRPRWGTWQELKQRNRRTLRSLLESSTAKETDAERKAQRFYASCLDGGSIAQPGSRSLGDIIGQLGGWSGADTTSTAASTTTAHADLQQLLQTLGRNFSLGALFTLGVSPLPFSEEQGAVRLSVPDLGLPSYDDYLNKTADDKVLSAYLLFMVRVRQLLGGEAGSAAWDARPVLDLEARLARSAAGSGGQSGQEFLTIAGLQDMLPFLDWTQYLRAVFDPLDPNDQSTVGIDNKEYFHSLADIINNTDGRVLREYALWSLVRQLLPALDGRYADAERHLAADIHGADNVAANPRWEFCVDETDQALPLGLGAIYTRATFDAALRHAADDIVTRIRDAFVSNLDSIAWMDSETRTAARDKSLSIKFQVGYQDGMLDPAFLERVYANVSVSGDFFRNSLELWRSRREALQRQLGAGADTGRWRMNPQTANAYYSPQQNTVVLPAALFQPPLFHPHFPMAVNFGRIGVIIGHELTHAFDDQGRRFDGQGRTRGWWTGASLAAFKLRSECLAGLYERYAAGAERGLSGRHTLGENVADLGGIKAAFRAYETWTEEVGEEALMPATNLTDRQAFFTAFSQVWCSVETPAAEEERRRQALRDTHSSPRLRTLAALATSPEFAATFNCPVASRMNPRSRCAVW